MREQISHTETLSLSKIQREFTQHIRSAEQSISFYAVEDRRMKIYRELVYNNIEGFLSSGFPVIRDIYSESNWQAMVRDFLIKHKCKTPYFLKIVEEFIDYLKNERVTQPADPAGLNELAHYEWVELALSISDVEINYTQIDADGDLLENHPVISPLALPLAYQYPVHKMSKNYLPEAATDTLNYLLVYRDNTDDVKFMQINEVTTQLLTKIRESAEITGYQVLQELATTFTAFEPEIIFTAGRQSLQQLRQRGIILGSSMNN